MVPNSKRTNTGAVYRPPCGRWAATIAASRPERTPGRATSRPCIGSSRTSSSTARAFAIAPSSKPKPPPTGSTSIWPVPIAARSGSRPCRSSDAVAATSTQPSLVGTVLTSAHFIANTSPGTPKGVTFYPSIPLSKGQERNVRTGRVNGFRLMLSPDQKSYRVIFSSSMRRRWTNLKRWFRIDVLGSTQTRHRKVWSGHMPDIFIDFTANRRRKNNFSNSTRTRSWMKLQI
jgi:hypothetical protein